MIVVRVELWSAVTGQHTELARMRICNTGEGTGQRGDYRGETLRGRDRKTLDHSIEHGIVTRTGMVQNHARQKLHVWHLVAKMLAAMGYGA